jgi:hypothetical protein
MGPWSGLGCAGRLRACPAGLRVPLSVVPQGQDPPLVHAMIHGGLEYVEADGRPCGGMGPEWVSEVGGDGSVRVQVDRGASWVPGVAAGFGTRAATHREQAPRRKEADTGDD